MPPAEAPVPVPSATLPWSIDWLLAALTDRDLPPLPAVEDPWREIVAVAVQHRLAPLLWARLRARPEAAGLSPAFIGQLRTLYLANAARSMQHVQELGRILAALDSAGIPVILLKGACLAQEVYGNLALRVVGDADLLIAEQMIDRAAVVMAQLDYQARFEYEQDKEMEWLHHMPPFGRPGGISVELHWTILFPRIEACFTAVDLDGMLGRAWPIQMGGARALVLAPEDMLLHLCIHAAGQHLFLNIGLRALFDVAELILRFSERLSWDEVVARSTAWCIERSVYLVLALAKQMAGATVPDEILHRLNPSPPPSVVVAQATANILQVGNVQLASPGFVEFGAHLSLGSRLRSVASYAFLKPTEMARLYPARADSWRIYLYYPARWLYLIRCYGTHAADLFQNNSELLQALQKQNTLTFWLRTQRVQNAPAGPE